MQSLQHYSTKFPGGAKTQYCQIHHWTNQSVKHLTFGQSTRKPYNDTSCLFRALALRLHGNEILEEETSNLFNQFRGKTGGIDPANLRKGFFLEENLSMGFSSNKSFCMAFRWKYFLYVLSLGGIGSTRLLVGEVAFYVFPINWIFLYGVPINKPNFQETPIYG